MSEARQAGALAYRARVVYEANPHVPGGAAEAEKLRLHDWPVEAQEWHEGWRSEATKLADAGPEGRSFEA